MLDQKKQDLIRAAILDVFSVFRSAFDIADITEFAMAMLVLKYLTDTSLKAPAKIEMPAGDLRYQVPDKASFYGLYANRSQPHNGARINKALDLIEASNSELHDMFLSVTFDSPRLGSLDQKDRVLCRLIEAFNTPALDFRTDHDGTQEAPASASQTILRHAAEAGGKRGGEYFTPLELSKLIARLMQPEHGESIYDPFCGSALTLITCSQLARQRSSGKGCNLYGQEMSGKTLGLAKMNLLLHGETSCQLAWGDTLRSPDLFGSSDRLRTYDVVVSHPPFSLREWGHEWAENDPYQRFIHGVPPRASGDYACISHMIASLKPESGRMAVVVSLGVLFRSGAERQIRERLIEENLIDAVIALPPKMLVHTSITTAVLILRTKKVDRSILFIDASRCYQQGKALNVLREADLNQIESTCQTRKSVDQYAKLASLAEVAANDYNLSVARYVEIREEEDKVDLSSLRAERVALRTELEHLEQKLAALLKEIGHD